MFDEIDTKISSLANWIGENADVLETEREREQLTLASWASFFPPLAVCECEVALDSAANMAGCRSIITVMFTVT